MPADFLEQDNLFKEDEWINDGDAAVIKPTGAIAPQDHSIDRKPFAMLKSI